MTQKKIYRIVLTAVILTALLALSAFADGIKGGFGQILGLDGGNFEAVSVVLDENGTAPKKLGEYAPVSASDTGLVGLYYVREVGDTSDGTLVYVYGSVADRNALFKTPISKYGDLYVKTNDRTPGMFGYNGQSWEWDSSWGSTRVVARITSSLTHFSTANGGDKNTTTDEERKEQWNTVIAANAANIKYTYTFTSDEIIPINEVESYTYGIAARWNNFTYKDLVVKFVAHVMDEDGKTTSYEYLHTAKDFNSSASGKEATYNYMNNATAKKTVDFTQKTSDFGAWTTELPSEGYLVGFEVYPIYNMTEWSKVTIGGTVNNWPVLSLLVINDPANYVISLPKAEAPKGVYAEDGAIVLPDARACEFAPANLIGAGVLGLADGALYADLDSTANAGLAGLYYVRVKATSEASASDPVLVYVEGDAAARKNIMTRKSGGTYDMATSSAFEVGKISYALGAVANGTNNVLLDLGSLTDFGRKSGTAFVIDDTTAENTFNKNSPTFQSRSIKYSFTSDEIIPVSELSQFKYSFVARYCNFYYNGLVSKFILHYVTLDGKKATVEYLHTAADYKSALGDSYDGDAYSTTHKSRIMTIDFTKNVSSFGSWQGDGIEKVPADAYVVGFEFLPFYGMTDYKNNVVRGGSHGNYASVGNQNTFVINLKSDNYTIVLPKAEAPKGVYAEDGAIVLPDERAYEFAPVNLVGEGVLGFAEGVSYANLDSTANADLAGLYYVRVKATANTSASDAVLVYVLGDISGRLILGDTVTDGSGNVDPVAVAGTSFIPETFVLPKTNASILNANGTRPYRMGAHINRHLTDGVIDKTEFKTELDNYVIRYSYASNEIVKANEFEQIKIGFGYVNYSYYNNLKVQPKVVFYVANDEGTIRDVTWIADEAKDLTKLTDASGNDTQFEIKVSKALSSVSDYYVVGFEIYPWSDVDLTEVSVAKTGEFYFGTVIHRDASFKITLPKAEAPVGVYDNGGKIGLPDARTYEFAPVALAADGKSVAELTYTDLQGNNVGLVGLYYVRVKATASNSASDAVLVYVEGSSDDRKKIGVTSGTNTLPNYAEGNKFEAGVFKGGVSNVSAGVSDAFSYLNQSVVSSTKAQTLWFYQNTKEAAQKALNDAITATNTGVNMQNAINAFYTDEYEALSDEDKAAAKLAYQENIKKDLLNNASVYYAYTPDEIIPTNELKSMKIGFKRHQGLNVGQVKSRVTFYVLKENGEIAECSTLTAAHNFIASAATCTINVSEMGLPDGYVLGFKVDHFAEVNAANISAYPRAAQHLSNALVDLRFSVTMSHFIFYPDEYSIVEDDKIVDGSTSLLLDGKIGVKVELDVLPGTEEIKVSGFNSNDDDYTAPEFTVNGTKATAVIYVAPKDAMDLAISFTVVADGQTEYAKPISVSIMNCVDAYQGSSDATLKALADALEVYMDYAYKYFDPSVNTVDEIELNETELVELGKGVEYGREGTLPSGLTPISTSLILEGSTTIRHYFRLAEGVAAPEGLTVHADDATICYIDIENIAAHELFEQKEVTVGDATISFSVLDYLKIAYDDDSDKKLENLCRAIYRYAVAAEAYINTHSAN